MSSDYERKYIFLSHLFCCPFHVRHYQIMVTIRVRAISQSWNWVSVNENIWVAGTVCLVVCVWMGAIEMSQAQNWNRKKRKSTANDIGLTCRSYNACACEISILNIFCSILIFVFFLLLFRVESVATDTWAQISDEIFLVSLEWIGFVQKCTSVWSVCYCARIRYTCHRLNNWNRTYSCKRANYARAICFQKQQTITMIMMDDNKNMKRKERRKKNGDGAACVSVSVCVICGADGIRIHRRVTLCAIF